MRVLVEQTRDCANHWLRQLSLLADRAPAEHAEHEVGVHVLMGGDLERDWDRWPDRDQILIGTQDMLLSRALNRGYAMSRFRWPVHFALLNNDALWVMDEVQLMGNGLATTAQLQAFRRKLGTALPTRSTWMSATMRPDWLATVDFEEAVDAQGGLEISAADHQHPKAMPRLSAAKALEKAGFEVSSDGKDEAALVLEKHTSGSLTLMVVNTVKRAKVVFEALQKKKPDAELVLLHSRFRQPDRDQQLAQLLKEPSEHGTIAVATQVIEAGVDVSAKMLITDLAPWSSLVQRFGRCNRRGEHNETRAAKVVWICPPTLDDDRKLLPYSGEELRDAAARLEQLSDVGPESLQAVEAPMSYTHVVRRKDLIDLFDTTPDLAGADIDVSRFIREADEGHVQVFWRDLGDLAPTDDQPGPARDELCSVSIGDLDPSKRSAWRWDHLERRWYKVSTVFPGLVLMLRASDGGYDEKLGWTGKSGWVEPITPGKEAGSNDSDRLSQQQRFESVAEHTERVVTALEDLLRALPELSETAKAALLCAGRWHDCGKGHPVFQGAMPEDRPIGIMAKSRGPMARYERPGFRHELASALAMLANGQSDLSAYLAAAHHGKVRLSIRSLPIEQPPRGAEETRFARGIIDGDLLPMLELGGGIVMPATALTLSYMELGENESSGPSWLARMLMLRDDPGLGPLRLALLEALLRVADWRASDDTEVK
jgi:CRISPR-associated endonuclease/helicase Cas3